MKVPADTGPDAAFQMAPMIDMVFLLLVFFMCASHLSQKQNIPLEMAEAAKAVVPEDRPNRWVVNITRDGDLFSGERPTTLEELKAAVTAEHEAVPSLKVYLRADGDAPHKEIRKVMDAMAAVGIDDFIFGVYQPPGGGS